MSDALDRRITVTEISPMDHPIDVPPDSTAAFVGRALRGPLNTPVLIESFAAFHRRFGGTWQRSSLGPAVQIRVLLDLRYRLFIRQTQLVLDAAVL